MHNFISISGEFHIIKILSRICKTQTIQVYFVIVITYQGSLYVYPILAHQPTTVQAITYETSWLDF